MILAILSGNKWGDILTYSAPKIPFFLLEINFKEKKGFSSVLSFRFSITLLETTKLMPNIHLSKYVFKKEQAFIECPVSMSVLRVWVTGKY